MQRRKFIKSLVGGSTLLLLPLGTWGCKGNEKAVSLRFGISTDIHQDIMHDASLRLHHFVHIAEEENLDFIIDLGDFCFPKKENLDFLNIWKSTSLKTFNVLGNHDMDVGSKDDFMKFVGMKTRYYSFDRGDFHFIVLDPNNLFIEGKYIPYQDGNFYQPAEQRAYVDPEQLEWLQKDLEQTPRHSIVFSHQSLENEKACQNRERVRAILEEANKKAGFTKVVAAFSGHDHTDYAKEINGIQYIQINSMSNQWVGEKFKCPERFADSINKTRPTLQFTVPYEEPLYAIVTLSKKTMGIKGVESTFVKPGPEELGIPMNVETSTPLVARISDRKFQFK